MGGGLSRSQGSAPKSESPNLTQTLFKYINKLEAADDKELNEFIEHMRWFNTVNKRLPSSDKELEQFVLPCAVFRLYNDRLPTSAEALLEYQDRENMREIAQIFSAELERIKKDIPGIEDYDFVYTPSLAAAFSRNIYDISESVSTQLLKYAFFFNSNTNNFVTKILQDKKLLLDSRVLQNKIEKYESYVGVTNFPIFVEVVFRTIELSQFPILTPGDFEQIKKLEINQPYTKLIKLADKKSFLSIQFIKTLPTTIRVIEG